MSRYPFKDKADEFMDTRRGCITDVSWKNQDRRFRRIERDMIVLKDQGKLSTLSPKQMTENDIKEFILYRKSRRVGASDLNHDISALDQLLTFSGNTAVQNCLRRNPGLKPVQKQVRLEPLPETTYEEILELYETLDHDDFAKVRAFTMVLMYIGTGARNKELRLADISDVDTERWTIHFIHVKGEDSYGVERTVPIPVELRPVVEQYLFDRAVWLRAHRASSKALFFTMGGDCGHMSSNSVRRVKSVVEKEIGKSFELRDCRRAYGQFYINKGLELEDVSVLMGHGTTKTTELYYCRKRESVVIEKAKDLW